ncbi:polyketide synthase [Chaetomium sp. MPI-SDFR-AT-0129]|nr:polyketide synthase [Chaetomium sp. MPI-SDFR-AT-0129]
MNSKEDTAPLAIVGIASRFAGGASSPEKLWEMIVEKRTGWSEIPSTRFELGGLYHPNGERIGTTHVKGAHFLEEDVALFNAGFFGMASDFASTLDPQYRMELELVYEALKSAGIPLEKIRGTNTSIYSGIMFRDYHDTQLRDPGTLPRYFSTGNPASMASNRVSHFFDLRGPSISIDTACSSALTALHLACQGLRKGESEVAVVTGASLMLNADMFIGMSNLGFLSPDGISHTFDHRANGYGRGEGGAAIILKPLYAARDGDTIRAVIRETGLNQNGKRTQTITAPSEAAQEALVRECYARVGMDPALTGFVEAHETGTVVGDPVEVAALAGAFGRRSEEEQGLQRVRQQPPLYIGSVKPNIGHTEGASGLASIVKVVLALEKGVIPPNTRFERANEKLRLEERGLEVPTEVRPWPLLGDTRRASVNNFGYGGSNAHAILEAYLPSQEPRLSNGVSNAVTVKPATVQRIFLLSAKDARACQRMATNLRQHLLTIQESQEDEKKNDPTFWDALAYTLGARRSVFPYTIAVAADNVSGLTSALEQVGPPSRAAGSVPPRLGWVFTGQGAQWYAMGRELIAEYPVFRSAIVECDRHMQGMGSKWSLLEELHRDESTSQVNNIIYSIALSTSIQIALVQLLRSWGIRPAAVTGHSSGEIAAAYAAGALDIRGAMAIAYLRGALVDKFGDEIVGRGGMMAVGLGRAAVVDGEYLSRVTAGTVVIACVNSQESVTVSGDIAGIEQLEGMLTAEGIFARRLRVNGAFHSEHMRPIADLFDWTLRGYLDSSRADIDTDTDTDPGTDFGSVIFSSPKTGKRVHEASTLTSPSHWVGNMLQPVEFESAFRHMCFGESTTATPDVDVVIEVGPHGALGGPIQQLMTQPEFRDSNISIPYFPCLIRRRNSIATMQQLAINFPNGLPPGRPLVLHNLPSYPWTHEERYWREPRLNKLYHHGGKHRRGGGPHELLGTRQHAGGAHPVEHTWRQIIRVSDAPWLQDHRVQSRIVYPAAGLVCMALEAARQLAVEDPKQQQQQQQQQVSCYDYELRDIDVDKALMIPETGETTTEEADGVDVQVTLSPCDEKLLGSQGWLQFRICSVSGENVWTQHCTGQIAVRSEVSADNNNPISLSRRNLTKTNYPGQIQPSTLWSALRSVGIHHGPAFQNLRRVYTKRRESMTIFSVAEPNTQSSGAPLLLHPTTLDSVFQAAFTLMPDAQAGRLPCAFVPRRIRSLRVRPTVSGRLSPANSPVTVVNNAAASSLSPDIKIDTKADTPLPIIELHGLTIQSLGQSAPNQSFPTDPHETDLCSQWTWAPDLSLADFSRLRAQLSSPVDPVEVATVQDLRRATIHYIHDTLQSLTPGDVEALQGHDCPDHLSKLYTWMTTQLELANQNVFAPDSSTWLPPSSSNDKTALLTRVSRSSTNGELLTRLATHAPSILRQQTSPLEVMLEGRLLYRYYTSALRWNRSTRQVGELVRLCTHLNPRARILEIGAGTGGGTQVILDALGPGRFERYDFTDVSSGFFDAARDRFKEWEGVMRFRKLDIGLDPTTTTNDGDGGQGFEAGGYDLVIACQVLHATKRMVRTLGNVRRLLKPGGRLVLLETTRDELDVSFCFGFLPGWWLGEEEQRKTTPSLTIPFWHQVLSESGFTGVDFEVHDCDSEEYYSGSTILSTAKPTDPSPSPGPASPEVPICIITGRSQPPTPWLDGLQTAITSITNGSLPTIESLESLASLESAGKICIVLAEADQPLLASASPAEFQAVVKLASSDCRGVLWVTRGGAMESSVPLMSLATGLLRTLRSEYRGRTRFVSLDLDAGREAWTGGTVDAVVRVLRGAFITDGDDGEDGDEDKRGDEDGVEDVKIRDFEYAERDGIIHVPRAFKHTELNHSLASQRSSSSSTVSTQPQHQPILQPNRPLRMTIRTPGLLDTLLFTDDPNTTLHPLPPDHIELAPTAIGLNFRDVMVAMGQLDGEGARGGLMGYECAGTITRLGPLAAAQDTGLAVGDRVCALLRGQWSTRPRTPWTNVMRIPHSLSDADAASLPVTVLIHAATGGVGQAAIILAQLAGAEVFATAGTPGKRAFLAGKYGISEDRIFSSRDVSFAAGVRAQTRGGRGVDVVVNSLAGQLLQESLGCLCEFGRFVEIGKRDMLGHSGLDLYPFLRNVSFMSVDLPAWMDRRGEVISRVLREVVALLEQKHIAPVSPVTVFPVSEVEKAFRVMQAGQHMGKIVVSVGEEDSVPVLPHAAPLRLRPDASYLIAGGLGGIGRSLCEWMAEHGARQLIVLSRSARQEQVAAVFDDNELFGEQGCQVRAVACDIADEAQLCEALQQRCADLPPIRGVIHAGMVLKDSAFENMTLPTFQAVLRPKVQGSWNLHHHLPHASPDDLDFFIMLSSLSGVVGSPGQANYAAGNVFQNALAHFRRARNLPAVAVDLGMVQTVGHVAAAAAAAAAQHDTTQAGANTNIGERLARAGFTSITETDVRRVLEWCILQSSSSSSSSSPSPISSSAASGPAQITTCINTGPGPHWDKAAWCQEGRFAGLRYRHTTTPTTAAQTHPVTATSGTDGKGVVRGEGTLRDQLASSDLSTAEAAEVICRGLVRKLASMFGLVEGDVVPMGNLAAYGVDSLVAVELRNWIVSQAGADVSIFELMQSPSLAELSGKLAAMRKN